MEPQEKLLAQSALDDPAQAQQAYRKRLRVWNVKKYLLVGLVSLCVTGGFVASDAELEGLGIILVVAGLVLMLIAPIPLIGSQSCPGHTHTLPQSTRLGELYAELVLLSVAGTLVMLLIAVLSSLGFEHLDAILHKVP